MDAITPSGCRICIASPRGAFPSRRSRTSCYGGTRTPCQGMGWSRAGREGAWVRGDAGLLSPAAVATAAAAVVVAALVRLEAVDEREVRQSGRLRGEERRRPVPGERRDAGIQATCDESLPSEVLDVTRGEPLNGARRVVRDKQDVVVRAEAAAAPVPTTAAIPAAVPASPEARGRLETDRVGRRPVRGEGDVPGGVDRVDLVEVLDRD